MLCFNIGRMDDNMFIEGGVGLQISNNEELQSAFERLIGKNEKIISAEQIAYFLQHHLDCLDRKSCGRIAAELLGAG